MSTSYTPTQLRNNSSHVFNDVQRSGWVKIVSKTRPDMVIMTQEALDTILAQKVTEDVQRDD